MIAREQLKRLLHALFGDYQYWKVYAIDLPYPRPELPEGISIREVSAKDLAGISAKGFYAGNYLGEGALGFGLFVEGELAALQGVWWGERYMSERNGRTWRIPEDAAKTNSLYTFEPYRGRGYAGLVKKYALAELGDRGFTRVYGRIWHSHKSSIRVSKKAGAKWIGCYIEVCPLGKRIALSIPIPGR